MTIVEAVIIALLLLSTVYVFISNAKNKKNLKAEMLRTESLTSEKQAVQQKLEKLETYFAVLSVAPAPFENTSQVSLSHAAKERLTSGEYKIQIICNDKNISNCRERLR